MDSQHTGVPRKRRGPPRTTGRGAQVKLSMHPDVLGPLSAWIAEQPDPNMTRQQAILKIVRQHLKIADKPKR